MVQVENDSNNDYKQFQSQEAKQARPIVHTHTHTHTPHTQHTHTHIHTHTAHQSTKTNLIIIYECFVYPTRANLIQAGS